MKHPVDAFVEYAAQLGQTFNPDEIEKLRRYTDQYVPDRYRDLLEQRVAGLERMLGHIVRLVVYESGGDDDEYLPHEPREALLILRKAVKPADDYLNKRGSL